MKPLHVSWQGKHPHKKISFRSTLEAYNKRTIFIPMEITGDLVESVALKKWGAWALEVQT